MPVIRSSDEVRRLLEATTHLRYKAARSTAYWAGLRASEVSHLKITDTVMVGLRNLAHEVWCGVVECVR